MAIDRRRLLLAGLAAALPWPVAGTAWAGSQRPPLLYSTRPRGGPYAAVVEREGREVLRLPLPTRAHGFAWDPIARRAAVFARRPGTWVLVFSPERPEDRRWLASVPGRHFYGHGCFSADGALLYASENDYEAARGCVGVYDARDGFRRLGEFDSGGVGPHDLCLTPDGRHLMVANGGIETHPDYGRAKLNLDRMRSSLALLDAENGAMVGQTTGPEAWFQLSWRHIAFDRQARAWVCAQYQGSRYEAAPLLARVAGDGLVLAQAPLPGWRHLEGYAAALALWEDKIAVTLPRADRVMLWRAEDGAFLESLDLEEIAAVATDQQGLFLGGTAGGTLLQAGLSRLTAEPVDNHAVWLV